MPDHFHGILFVKERIEKPLGKVLLGFKQGCNKAFRALFPSVPSVAVLQQQTEQQQTGQKKEDRKHGLLFEPNYNDKLLLQKGACDEAPEARLYLSYCSDGSDGRQSSEYAS